MIRTCKVIVSYNIRKWKSNYYMLFGLVYLFLISDMMLRPARKLAEQLGVHPSVSSFPLIWNSRFFLMLFFFGVVLFYSDALFQDTMSAFIMIRCGKMRFMAAQICYIILVGIMIPIVFFFIQFGLFLPVAGKGWGNSGEPLLRREWECRRDAGWSFNIIFFGIMSRKKRWQLLF